MKRSTGGTTICSVSVETPTSNTDDAVTKKFGMCFSVRGICTSFTVPSIRSTRVSKRSSPLELKSTQRPLFGATIITFAVSPDRMVSLSTTRSRLPAR